MEVNWNGREEKMTSSSLKGHVNFKSRMSKSVIKGVR